MTRYIPKKNKETVAKRAKNCCEYCHSQMDYSPNNFSIEHIIPIVKGGNSKLDNLALSCQSCNNKKYTKVEVLDKVSGETVNLYHPRIDNWSKHFKWNDDKSIMIGTTPKGRATVATLKLNRKGVLQLRKVLFDIEKHPVLFK